MKSEKELSKEFEKKSMSFTIVGDLYKVVYLGPDNSERYWYFSNIESVNAFYDGITHGIEQKV